MTDDFDARPDYPPIDPTEDEACRTLWIAAVVQALVDAIGTNSASGGRLAKAEARRWLNGWGEVARDFDAVSHLANLDPDKLRKRLQEIIRKNEPFDFRCIKKAKVQNRTTENRQKYLRRSRRNAVLRATKQQANAANDNFNNQPMETMNE